VLNKQIEDDFTHLSPKFKEKKNLILHSRKHSMWQVEIKLYTYETLGLNRGWWSAQQLYCVGVAKGRIFAPTSN